MYFVQTILIHNPDCLYKIHNIGTCLLSVHNWAKRILYVYEVFLGFNRSKVMTAGIVGRPRRIRPIDRVNYKLDSALRSLLTDMAIRKGRNEGAQIERLILQGEAIDRILNKGDDLSHAAIEKEISAIWVEVTGEKENEES